MAPSQEARGRRSARDEVARGEPGAERFEQAGVEVAAVGVEIRVQHAAALWLSASIVSMLCRCCEPR